MQHNVIVNNDYHIFHERWHRREESYVCTVVRFKLTFLVGSFLERLIRKLNVFVT